MERKEEGQEGRKKGWGEPVGIVAMLVVLAVLGGFGGWQWARNHQPPRVTLIGGGSVLVAATGPRPALGAVLVDGNRAVKGARVEWFISGGTFAGGAHVAVGTTSASGQVTSPVILAVGAKGATVTTVAPGARAVTWEVEPA